MMNGTRKPRRHVSLATDDDESAISEVSQSEDPGDEVSDQSELSEFDARDFAEAAYSQKGRKKPIMKPK